MVATVRQKLEVTAFIGKILDENVPSASKAASANI